MSAAQTHDIAVGDGVVRVRVLHAAADGGIPLVCLHPAPFDGRYFAEFATLPGHSCTTVAPDYPGYGGSTGPATPPTIGDYAVAMLAALAGWRADKPLNLLGFHTGCLVACEMALQSVLVDRLVLIDAPVFSGDEQAQKHAENFTATDPASWAFGAAYSYDCAGRLPQVGNTTLAIATGGRLQAATRRAAALLPDCRLEELPEVTRPVFRNGGAQLAQLVGSFLLP